MRNWKVNLERFGISNARRDEILAFCRQYPEKAEALKKDKVADAQKAERYHSDLTLIEETAKEADAFLAPWIIQSVTENKPAWQLIQKGMPANEKEFNAKRRRFYVFLSEKL